MWGCSTDDKHAKDRSKQIDKEPVHPYNYSRINTFCK